MLDAIDSRWDFAEQCRALIASKACTGLFAVLVLACAAVAVAALRLSRHLPPAANHVPAPAPSPAGPAHPGSNDRVDLAAA